MDHLIQYRLKSERTPYKVRAAFDPLGRTMESRMTALETRFDTILPTLATKEDLKNLEVSLHRDIRSNTWLMITWVTADPSPSITGLRQRTPR